MSQEVSSIMAAKSRAVSVLNELAERHKLDKKSILYGELEALVSDAVIIGAQSQIIP